MYIRAGACGLNCFGGRFVSICSLGQATPLALLILEQVSVLREGAANQTRDPIDEVLVWHLAVVDGPRSVDGPQCHVQPLAWNDSIRAHHCEFSEKRRVGCKHTSLRGRLPSDLHDKLLEQSVEIAMAFLYQPLLNDLLKVRSSDVRVCCRAGATADTQHGPE